MDRKLTKPIPPGKIKKYLRETRMPEKIKEFIPPFEARVKHMSGAKVTKVSTAPLAKSGDTEADTYARTFWENRRTTSSPPPLAPLSNREPQVVRSTPQVQVPPLFSLTSGIIENPPLEKETQPTEEHKLSWAEEVNQAEEDLKNDVLELSSPAEELEKLLEEPFQPQEDLFHGIIIKDPGVKRKMWYIFPPGRPKVQVIVRNRKVTLRCLGRVKEFSLAE
ncbi:hypothetical protein CVS40_9813 [Lucilia cuprina]|nr:hypothetical protein CVS40_9813 [Lucilia cuprina]